MAEVIHTKDKLMEEEESEILVRIFGYDINGSKNVYVGLTKIKGISWAISNAICIKLSIPRNKKINELTKEDIQRIESFLNQLDVPEFLKNRRFDLESGETKHKLGTDFDMRREFDIKRLIKMKSYRGARHAAGQPVRGQKTRSHFRSKANKQVVGLKKRRAATKEEK